MTTVQLRRGNAADLDTVNALISRAIATWQLPERVQRLSLPLYQYQAEDLDHLELWLAIEGKRPVAVAAWEAADPGQLPSGCRGLLLHGLYVDPERAGGGLGRTLLHACLDAARSAGLDGVLVKASRAAAPFFEHCGLVHLPVTDPARHYDPRYWLAVT